MFLNTTDSNKSIYFPWMLLFFYSSFCVYQKQLLDKYMTNLVFTCSVPLPVLFFDSQSLLEMGTEDLTFVQLNQLIGRKTGGISVYPFTSSVRGKEDPCSHMIVRGKAMGGRAEDLYDLVYFFVQTLNISCFKFNI